MEASLNLFQITLLTFYAFIAINDSLIFGNLNQPVIVGFFTGLIMGDVQTGLFVGGTVQLMRLGLAAFGGASIPDYLTGTLLGVVFAVQLNDTETGLALAIPIAVIMTQLDILGRFMNVFILHQIDRAIDKMQLNRISPLVMAGSISWGLSRAIPIFIALVLGEDAVRMVTENAPQWLMGGLQVSGKVLPALGVAILLRYLPVKSFLPYLIVGFVLSAYLQVPMLGIALIGGAIAMVMFKNESAAHELANNAVTMINDSTMTFEGGFDGDE